MITERTNDGMLLNVSPDVAKQFNLLQDLIPQFKIAIEDRLDSSYHLRNINKDLDITVNDGNIEKMVDYQMFYGVVKDKNEVLETKDMKINEQKVTLDLIKNQIDIAFNKQDMHVSFHSYVLMLSLESI